MESYKKIRLSHEMGLIDTPPLRKKCKICSNFELPWESISGLVFSNIDEVTFKSQIYMRGGTVKWSY